MCPYNPPDSLRSFVKGCLKASLNFALPFNTISLGHHYPTLLLFIIPETQKAVHPPAVSSILWPRLRKDAGQPILIRLEQRDTESWIRVHIRNGASYLLGYPSQRWIAFHALSCLL